MLPDLTTRGANWIGGIELMDDSLTALFFGMGYGSYPRTALLERSSGAAPTNFRIEQPDGKPSFLRMQVGSPLYIGQKVAIRRDQHYRLELAERSREGAGALSVTVCEKLLLYSENCTAANFQSSRTGEWEEFGATIALPGPPQRKLFGLLRRPVELTLFGQPGDMLDVTNVRLLDVDGRDLVANGDFADGMQRWYFTDDAHLVWQIKNQYLASYFEGGVLGLVTLLLVAVGGIAGALRAAQRGDRIAMAYAASLVAMLCCCLFDYLLVAPRLAALFYLTAVIGLCIGPPSATRPASERRWVRYR